MLMSPMTPTPLLALAAMPQLLAVTEATWAASRLEWRPPSTVLSTVANARVSCPVPAHSGEAFTVCARPLCKRCQDCDHGRVGDRRMALTTASVRQGSAVDRPRVPWV